MIRNGLYVYSSKARDGVDGGADGVMILRDGTMLGGTEYFYFVGTYTCANGKWKGEFTNEEHTPAPIVRPMARKGSVSIGFSGTYCDTDAQINLTALVGKRSLQYSATFRLLVQTD
jgi:hypothetical protein